LGFRIAEGNTPYPSFSFFRFIYIGHVHTLSPIDKERIIAHEHVHASQLHSFDILLINILGILFWFNPIIRTYHKTFVQLHEFEADARAVKIHEVNEYCSLLARVALMSADISMANYFNKSLTIKRIEMMRKIKIRLGRWKIGALILLVMGLFFVSACHDQVMNDVADIARSSSMATQVPEKIQKRFEQLKSDNPKKKYLLLEMNDHATARIDELKKKYGLPTSVEVFKLDDKNQTGENPIIGKSDAGVDIRRAEGSSETLQKGFLILEYNEQTEVVTDLSTTGDVYSIVEQSPEPGGGMPALFKYIGGSMVYPKGAVDEKAEGTVYVEFIVETNGDITSPQVVKGVHPLLDAEALRVVKGSPAWIPGKQKGVDVRVKMVLPIKFSLENADVKK
jgi:TonB family protein